MDQVTWVGKLRGDFGENSSFWETAYLEWAKRAAGQFITYISVIVRL